MELFWIGNYFLQADECDKAMEEFEANADYHRAQQEMVNGYLERPVLFVDSELVTYDAKHGFRIPGREKRQ